MIEKHFHILTLTCSIEKLTQVPLFRNNCKHSVCFEAIINQRRKSSRTRHNIFTPCYYLDHTL